VERHTRISLKLGDYFTQLNDVFANFMARSVCKSALLKQGATLPSNVAKPEPELRS
jgi:hypothetical protein